jgi:hypothetical protein
MTNLYMHRGSRELRDEKYMIPLYFPYLKKLFKKLKLTSLFRVLKLE